MSESTSPIGGPLSEFLERCAEKVDFADLCLEIEKLGYKIDYDVHKTKGSAILEIFKQRNLKGIQEDVDFVDERHKDEDDSILENEAVGTDLKSQIEKKTVSPVKAITRVLRATAVPIAKIAAQFRTTKASLLRQKSKHKESPNVTGPTEENSKEVSSPTVLDPTPVCSNAVLSPSLPLLVSVPSSIPVYRSCLRDLANMTSLELGEGEVTDANAESEGIDPDSEINLKPKLIAGKRVHFSPVLSTLLNLQEMQCANHHVEEGSLEDDREIEDAVKKMLQDQKMVDDVYKQIEMWGEALGTSSSQEEDLSDIIPETSNSTPVVRMIRVSNIQKKSKVREPTLTGGSLVDSSKSSTKKGSFIATVSSRPLQSLPPVASPIPLPRPPTTTPLSSLPPPLCPPARQEGGKLLLQIAPVDVMVPSDSEKTDSDSVGSVTAFAASATVRRVSRLKSPSRHVQR